MKWVLVDKHDNIISTKELHSGYGENAAKMYFVGIKKMKEEDFDKLWRVMSLEKYNLHEELATRNGKQYEWWKDEWSNPDIDVVEDKK